MGLNLDSCLNELSYFHAAEGLPPDLANDVLEGIAVDVKQATAFKTNLRYQL